MKSWFARTPRTKYDTVQVQNGRVVQVHAEGVSLKQAVEHQHNVDAILALCKLLAPSGPQDAHSEIRISGTTQRVA